MNDYVTRNSTLYFSITGAICADVKIEYLFCTDEVVVVLTVFQVLIFNERVLRLSSQLRVKVG